MEVAGVKRTHFLQSLHPLAASSLMEMQGQPETGKVLGTQGVVSQSGAKCQLEKPGVGTANGSPHGEHRAVA